MPETQSATESLAAFVAGTDFGALPPTVIASTKQRVLDTIGVALAGSTAPGCDAARTTILTEGATGTSTIWASGERAGSRGAAFVNGMHAAALDYDSVYERGSVHPDIVTVPAAWSVAEQVGADGKSFLAAVALGNEVACRFGAANLENKGWFYTAAHGVFGAAAAAAKLLGLDSDGITNTLGLALSRAGGSQQALLEKSLAKRAQSGFAAEAGVFAAQLAAAGISGPKQAVEGKFGYHTLYSEGDPTVLVQDLGTHYESLATAIKKYPSCTANHVPIDLLIDLANSNDWVNRDIERVEVALSPFANQLVGGTFNPMENPQVSAQFSIHYSAASALLRRRLGIAEIQDDAVLESRIAEFIGKVDVKVDDLNSGKFAPASVSVTTTAGTTLEAQLENVPGTLANPLSDEQIAAKFRDCAAFGLQPREPAEADALAATLSAMEKRDDLDGLLKRS